MSEYGNDQTTLDGLSPSLRSDPHGGSNVPLVDGAAVSSRGREGGATLEESGDVSPSLRASSGGGSRQMVRTFAKEHSAASAEDAETWKETEVARSLTEHDAHRQDSSPALIVPMDGGATHALTGEGFDASEDGTGRGTPIVLPTDGDERCMTRPSEEVTPSLRSQGSQPAVLDTYNQNEVEGGVVNTLSTSPTTAVAPTLRGSVGSGGGGQKDDAVVGPPVPAGWGHGGGNVDGMDESVEAVHRARALDGRSAGASDVAPTIRTDAGTAGGPKLSHGELPEGEACAWDPPPDGRRYSACGDGVASPQAHFIGLRLLSVMRGLDPDSGAPLG